MNYPKLIVHFMYNWAHRYAGVRYTQDYFFDHQVRVETRKAIDRKMFEMFGDAGLGAENPEANPDIDCCGGILGKAIFGIPVEFHEDRAPDVMTLNINAEQMESYGLSKDFVNQFPMQQMRKQVEEIRRNYGRVNPTYDLFHHGVVNLGLDIRGNEMFMDIYERPDQLRAFFERLGDGLLEVADYCEQLMGKMPLYKVGHCSMCMFPPEFYMNLVLDIDAKLARRIQPFGIHHHGRTDNGHLDAYKELQKKSGVLIEMFDLDWNADFEYFRELFPKAYLFYLMDPSAIASGNEDSYKREVARVVDKLGSAHGVSFVAGDLDDRVSPDQIMSLAMSVREVIGS